MALAAAGLGLAASLAGPTAYTLSTLQQGHSGSIVTAGAAGFRTGGGPGGGAGPGGGPGGGNPGWRGFPGGAQNQQGQLGPQGQTPPGGFPGGPTGRNGGPQQNDGTTPPDGGMPDGTPPGNGPGGRNGSYGPGGQGGGTRPGGRGGAMGGLLGGTDVGSEARKLLETDADDYTWAAAAIGAQNAASYQLATGEPVMAVGGFNGTDPSPALARFQQYVEDGRIHYSIAGGAMGGGPAMGTESSTSAQISAWVQQNFEEVTAGSVTFYDLTRKAAE
ncbi:hypothetical protein GCM10009535_47630 [Streptomyces thermocarboxydovorans]|uniref:Putative mannosyltransferase YkcA/B-like C-terminal domain-containing protein n=1 Tax=Streptomyces thermocarboxydovorans TaxID=59298 RepID=A0ABP3ST80_9ACTN